MKRILMVVVLALLVLIPLMVLTKEFGFALVECKDGSHPIFTNLYVRNHHYAHSHSKCVVVGDNVSTTCILRLFK